MRSSGKTKRTTAAAAVTALFYIGCGNSDDAAPDTPAEPLARYAGYQTVEYGDPTHWLCSPTAKDDACDKDLSASVVGADGTAKIEAFAPAGDAPIDCFYVYPTISRDQTRFSDWQPSPEEEGYVARHQVGRLGAACRVIAPVYRQVTLTALTAGLNGGTPPMGPTADSYADVLDAFRTYMARDNGGRGFVLIGHSQGAGMLKRLMIDEVDPNEDVRQHLVSAYIIGSALAVPEGAVVGGDFKNVPLCASPTQTGCALSWASFRSTAPPPDNSLFGKAAAGAGVAACVNPAAVAGGSATLRPYFPTSNKSSILGSLGSMDSGQPWLKGTEIQTPFVMMPNFLSGACVSERGFNYLSITVHADPADARADDFSGDISPEWGLHLVDISVVMGDIVALVQSQAAAYQAKAR
jgi:hypothetical protein